ncbi:MAG: thioredoxin family protein, partial [Thermoproteota archaeon]|nr:thioredoxin family protein [Thermoproteota archaeon]
MLKIEPMFRQRSRIRIPFFTLTIAFFAVMMIANFFAVIMTAKGSVHSLPKTSPSLRGATGWLNTRPLTLEGLRGKVVLVDFWTYTCINWIRTLPYVREWASKYQDQGLVVIGVHTPEFSFEKKQENVTRAMKEMNISYPVALDSQYEIWDSFRNQYWPAVYLIDAKGRIRYQKFGEEDYQETERQIQLLLKEANAQSVSDKPAVLEPHGIEAAADWQNLQSPESYMGYGRMQSFASREKILPDQPVLYSTLGQLKLNQWGLSGEWIVKQECIQLSKRQGKIRYRFHARDLHLVMGPKTNGTSVKFRVLIDGQPPGQSHGLDIDSAGNGLVTEQRM